MAKKTVRNFQTKTGYKKYLAFGHMHKVFENTPGNTPVSIQGKPVAVQHERVSRKAARSKSVA